MKLRAKVAIQDQLGLERDNTWCGLPPKNKMSSNVAAYHGHPLDPEKRQIRLIKLRPGPDDAPVICSSSVVSLDDKPEYMALSYVGGSPLDPEHMNFNGCVDFPVTRNLHTALVHLHEGRKEVTVWADALSINQSDVKEKGHQISLMGDMYSHSTHTCLSRRYLGKE